MFTRLFHLTVSAAMLTSSLFAQSAQLPSPSTPTAASQAAAPAPSGTAPWRLHSRDADSDFQAPGAAPPPAWDWQEKSSTSGRHHDLDWANFTTNAMERSRPGGAFVGACFYLIGGETDTATYGFSRAKRVEIFDGPTLSWRTSVSDMPIGVSNISSSVTAIGNKIFVFGGWTGAAVRTNAIQVYDTLSDSWSVHPTTLPQAIYGCVAVATTNHGIFLCGGSVKAGMGGAAIDSCYFFDPISGNITTTTPMPTAQFLHSADIFNDTVYAAAGYDTGTTFQAFDVASQTWTTLPDLPYDRAGCGVTAVTDYVVLYGGDWSGYRKDADAYHTPSQSFDAAIAASLGLMPVGKRSFAYDDYQSPFLQAALAINGWANDYLPNCTALY